MGNLQMQMLYKVNRFITNPLLKMKLIVLNLIKIQIDFWLKILNGLMRRLQPHLMKVKLDNVFGKKNESIVYDFNGIKLNLKKSSKLSEYILFDDFENEELLFTKRFLRAGDVFIDIGSNIGLFALSASNIVGGVGKVYAFEPGPETFLVLTENIALNKFTNILPFQCGISNEEGILLLNTSTDFDAWNTFTKLDTMEAHTSSMYNNKVEVSTIRLDKFLQDQRVNSNSISLIKIDVEGWEKFALLGSVNLLRADNAPAILIEFTEENTWRAGYTCHELYDIIESYGYSLFRYNSVMNTLIPEIKRLQYPYDNLVAIKNSEAAFKRLSSN